MTKQSSLVHGLIAAALFLLFVPLAGPGAGLAGAWFYLGREGAEAQRATGRPKSETAFLPFMPWRWPAQMQRNALVPCAVSLALAIAWAATVGFRPAISYYLAA